MNCEMTSVKQLKVVYLFHNNYYIVADGIILGNTNKLMVSLVAINLSYLALCN